MALRSTNTTNKPLCLSARKQEETGVDPNYTTAKNREILSFVRRWRAASYSLIIDMSCTDCQKVKVELRLIYAKKT
jgi:hypothetical protein